MPNIVCVTPSIRPDSMSEFRKAWAPLFEKHNVTLITVWDSDNPSLEVEDNGSNSLPSQHYRGYCDFHEHLGLICRLTDAVRNLGFIHAAKAACYDYILTLDDDVHPPHQADPIQEHLDVLERRVPISWMNTALDTGLVSTREGVKRGRAPYLRGFPYSIRDEAPVMMSHGVWNLVPDFDGRTQLELTSNNQRPGRLPFSLPYFRGPIPRGVFMPICGMNLMVRKEALPYLYFAPMGPDSGVEGLNRFADIWMGLRAKAKFDELDWAIYTGASTVTHTRASDPFKNFEQEKLGVEWNEQMVREMNDPDTWNEPTTELHKYIISWFNKANRFEKLIKELQAK